MLKTLLLFLSSRNIILLSLNLVRIMYYTGLLYLSFTVSDKASSI